MRPIRSFLYAPGNRERLIEKAPDAGADAVMFDLADSVPPAEKDKARRLVTQALAALDGRDLYVKLNDAESGELDADIDAVARAGLCGVLLPEVSDPQTVRDLDAALSRRETERGLPARSIEVILLLETAAAVIRAYELAAAAPRVASLCCATAEGGDLIRSLGSGWSPTGPERTYLRGRIVLAARAANLPWPIDGVFADLEDPAGLETESDIARRAGCRGKLAIHPKQIPVINRIFTPTDSEIAWSERIVALADETESRGAHFLRLNGFALGPATIARARSTLAEAAHYAR